MECVSEAKPSFELRDFDPVVQASITVCTGWDCVFVFVFFYKVELSWEVGFHFSVW